MLTSMYQRFKRDEDGAVTVDWVVLTAAIVGIGLVVMTTVAGGTSQAADNTSGSIIDTVAAGSALNQTTEEFLAGYNPVSSTRKGGSGSDSWVRGSYARNSALSDAALQSSYSQNYAYATSGGSARAADRVAVQERIMNERGIGIPSGNKTAAQIASSYRS